jgi:DNA-directed RNA polymerase II subunit RPB2
MTNYISNQEDIDKLIKLYYKQPRILYEHLFASYNQLVEEIIPYCLVQEPNYFYQNVINDSIYYHGIKCSNIRIKPPTFDNDNEIKFPSDARKNHLNYFATIVADIVQVLEKINITTGEKTIKEISEVEKEASIANIPVMIRSKYCSTQIKKDLHGECKYDPGGYFIVNGQEKVVMSIEKMVDNKILVFTKKEASFLNADGLVYIAQINSRKNDWSDNLQIITLKNRKDNDLVLTTSSLVDIPLFVLFRAFGIESDQDIISRITYDLDDVKMINLLRSSMEYSTDDNGAPIRTKEEAIEYLSSKLRRNRMISQSDENLAKIQKKMMLEKIFRQDFLPHLGEDIPKKIAYLGYMVNKLLNVWLKRSEQDDRDALQNKRIETPGILIGQLFRQNWSKMLKEIGKIFAKKNTSDEIPINIMNQIKPSIIEQGIKTSLATGIWGINKTKKGVAQSLQRLSWVQAISYLRRVMAPSLDSSTSKVTSIRQGQNLQAQFLCICETPEGQKIGIVKSLAMMSSISHQNSVQYEIINAILKSTKMKHPSDINPLHMKSFIKIFINGDWIGVCKLADGIEINNYLKKSRRQGLIDKYTTICLDYSKKEIKIYSDGGRLIRPIMIVSNNKLNLSKELINDIEQELSSKDGAKGWKKILSKYQNLVDYEDVESSNYIMCADRFYRLDESENNKNRNVENKDTSKINRYGDYRWIKYTHCDFHAWTQLGIIAGNIPFSNHNHSARNIIHFSQGKQAIGIYLTSYKDRMDISQILYYPQVPIVTTKTMEYNHCLDLPYGENVIVAIMSYNGYNQEDSIIINQSAIDRGIFRADTLKKYHSEIDKNPSTNQDDIFTKPDKNKVADMKQGNYSKLNDKGICPEETEIQNEDFIIGKVSPIQPTGDSSKVYKDSSDIFKSNVNGVIDRVHTGVYNAEGYEMYNVRVRMERIPVIGDKFTNRHGQKGTIGINLMQKDMPFTSEGIVPDIIMNPHCQPSRMTIGQLIECIASKIGAIDGTFIDGTPYCDYDVRKLPDILEKLGYNKYGNEILYCGMTGKKIQAEIFMGPTYTVRLKHMTADKYHSRSRGPRQALTRQPLEGRSRDGGLKIGEMEKDAMIAHGMAQFLKERMMETSDITKVHVCDECGLFASKVIDKDYYWCKACHNSTKISAVVIPYAAKLLFQELMSVNILPRIRTEKNIFADEA